MIVNGWNTKYSSGDTVVLRKGRYGDESTALQVFSEIGEPLCTPTICLQGYGEKPLPGNVFIKDYSENEGVLKALQNTGIVGDVIRTVPFFDVTAYEVPLLVDVD